MPFWQFTACKFRCDSLNILGLSSRAFWVSHQGNGQRTLASIVGYTFVNQMFLVKMACMKRPMMNLWTAISSLCTPPILFLLSCTNSFPLSSHLEWLLVLMGSTIESTQPKMASTMASQICVGNMSILVSPKLGDCMVQKAVSRNETLYKKTSLCLYSHSQHSMFWRWNVWLLLALSICCYLVLCEFFLACLVFIFPSMAWLCCRPFALNSNNPKGRDK